MWLIIPLCVIGLVILLAHFLPQWGAKPLSLDKQSSLSKWIMALVFLMIFAQILKHYLAA